ncbi:hypothetical protein MiSe_28840 [Microseira wollei NIES-4236]|uniref:Uncharacterized protein n=1 Tax=Microseira wollei NIES-4236 TaxID=2530354 RepID=A0AAV3XBJ7_9CYAN|nr:hypothetical protein [Microseira wollei]GET38130.1 hypothetical protein MiSe_28840 [Microseira wollei NIES-4236]
MQSNVVQMPLTSWKEQLQAVDYHEAEQQFVTLLELEDLDTLEIQPEIAENFARILDGAIQVAYQEAPGESEAAHRFLQRVLYRINRLKLFWYDDLRNYTNERSGYLRIVRDRIEYFWQKWELAQIDVEALKQLDVKQALIERAAYDVAPPLNENSRYIRAEMSEAGYRHLLAIASFDGLVEASRLSRILGGAANEVQCTLVRVLLEEYGSGKLTRKHSTFFAKMLA